MSTDVEVLPDEVTSMIGVSQYPETATFDAEYSYAYNTLAATQNAAMTTITPAACGAPDSGAADQATQPAASSPAAAALP